MLGNKQYLHENVQLCLIIGIFSFFILATPTLAYLPTDHYSHVYAPEGVKGFAVDNNGNLSLALAFGKEDYQIGLIGYNTSNLRDQTLPGVMIWWTTNGNITANNIHGMTFGNNSLMYFLYERNFGNGTVTGAVYNCNKTCEANHGILLENDLSWKFFWGFSNESYGTSANFHNVEPLGTQGQILLQVRNLSFPSYNTYVMYDWWNLSLTPCNWGQLYGKDLDISLDDDYIFILAPKCVENQKSEKEKVIEIYNKSTLTFLYTVDMVAEFGLQYVEKITSDDTWQYIAKKSTIWPGYRVIYKLNLSLAEKSTNFTALYPIDPEVVMNETFDLTAYLETNYSGNITWFLDAVNISVSRVLTGYAGVVTHEINTTTIGLEQGAHNWSAYYDDVLGHRWIVTANFTYTTGAVAHILDFMQHWFISSDIQGVDETTLEKQYKAKVMLIVLTIAVVLSAIGGYISGSGTVALITFLGGIFGFTAIGWIDLWIGIMMIIIPAGLMSLRFFNE